LIQEKMSFENFERFLKSGAILRWENFFYLMIGPFGQAPQSSEISLFSPDFFLEHQNKKVSGSQAYKISPLEFRSHLQKIIELHGPKLKFDWRPPRYEEYQSAFNQVQSEIKAERFQKAVPVLFEQADAEFGPHSCSQVLLNLMSCSERLFVYGVWDDQGGMLGASPEILVSVRGGELRSMALAGTQLKDTKVCRLLEDPKELHEHQLVVEDILQVLKSFGSVQSDGPHILELPSLWHLKTEMRMALREHTDLVQLIRKLHPTPAVGVFPREDGFALMKSLPQSTMRKKFGAPFAMFFPNGDMVSVVAIRNIQWSRNQILLGAGGGVVHSSQIENEWLELEGKRQSVKSLMGL